MSFLVHGLLNRSPHSIAVLWVNASPHTLSTWKALQRIKSPDPVTLVGPIEVTHRCRVVDPIAGAAESLCLAKRFLDALALGQIEHECKALVASFFEQSGANKHRNAAAVFPNILLLEGLNYPG